eukprot:scaffold119992_cov33-Phaeocystis_antarctica.AAC.1
MPTACSVLSSGLERRFLAAWMPKRGCSMVCALGNKVADFTACDRLGPAQLDAILPALGPPRRRRAAALPHAASLPL